MLLSCQPRACKISVLCINLWMVQVNMLANRRTAVDEHGCGKVDNRGRRPWRRSRRPSPSAASWPGGRPDAFLPALTGSLNHPANMLSTRECHASCWSMPRSSATLRMATRRSARPWPPRRCLTARPRPNPGPARLARIYDTIRPQGCPRITGRYARGHAPRWHKSRPSVIGREDRPA